MWPARSYKTSSSSTRPFTTSRDKSDNTCIELAVTILNNTQAAKVSKKIQEVGLQRSGISEKPSSSTVSINEQPSAVEAPFSLVGEITLTMSPENDITSVKVQHCKLTNIDLQCIFRCVSASVKITGLTFYNCSITGQEFDSVDLILMVETSLLKSLTFDYMNLEGFRVCVKDLIRPVGTLQHLSLRGNRIDDQTMTEIAERLKTNVSLTSLNLFHNCIGPVGVSELAAALSQNHTLTSLSLGKNCISDDGAIALLTALGKHNLSSQDAFVLKKKSLMEGHKTFEMNSRLSTASSKYDHSCFYLTI